MAAQQAILCPALLPQAIPVHLCLQPTSKSVGQHFSVATISRQDHQLQSETALISALHLCYRTWVDCLDTVDYSPTKAETLRVALQPSALCMPSWWTMAIAWYQVCCSWQRL